MTFEKFKFFSRVSRFFLAFAICSISIATPIPAHAWDGMAAPFNVSVTGDETDPYIIDSAEKLAYLAVSVNEGNSYGGKYFKLAADIDLAGHDWTPIGRYVTEDSDDAKPFSGVFDGGGHEISNAAINAPGETGLGLFGYVKDGGVKDLVLSDVYIEGQALAGGLAGVISNASVSGVTVSGAVRAEDEAGGLAGRAGENVTISGCYADLDVITRNDAGGHVGAAEDSADISGSVSFGDIQGEPDAGEIASVTGAPPRAAADETPKTETALAEETKPVEKQEENIPEEEPRTAEKEDKKPATPSNVVPEEERAPVSPSAPNTYSWSKSDKNGYSKPTPDDPSRSAARPSIRGAVTADGLRLRAGHSTSAEEMERFAKGTEVALLQRYASGHEKYYWFKVNVKGREGWMYGEYIQPDEDGREGNLTALRPAPKKPANAASLAPAPAKTGDARPRNSRRIDKIVGARYATRPDDGLNGVWTGIGDGMGQEMPNGPRYNLTNGKLTISNYRANANGSFTLSVRGEFVCGRRPGTSLYALPNNYKFVIDRKNVTFAKGENETYSAQSDQWPPAMVIRIMTGNSIAFAFADKSFTAGIAMQR
ncbi:MAG: SH3 domain-containing protein [Synergistaceae bacterium]|jgi:uncharacterized protein YraI|nr:SH3 domain-containing protein [Synergistaceae bacterium]